MALSGLAREGDIILCGPLVTTVRGGSVLSISVVMFLDCFIVNSAHDVYTIKSGYA